MKQSTWSRTVAVGVLVLAAGAVEAQMRAPLQAVPLHDRECVGACRGELDTCLDAAAEDLRVCVEPCADERAAVRAACATDPASTACAEARAALRACAGPCLKQYDSTVDECFGDARMCVADCPPADDLPCVRACLRERASCLSDLRAEVKACRDRCGAEVAAARRICAADPESEECRAASVAARTCLAPCTGLIRKGLYECRRETRACLAACDDEDPVVDGPDAAP